MDNKSLIQRYNKLPEFLRWVLFLTICYICYIYYTNFFGLWTFLGTITYSMGTYEFVFAIFHPVIVQVLFLILIFYTVPRYKLKWIIASIVFRSLFLFPVLLNYALVSSETPYFDWYDFLLIVGEIVTLVASIGVYKILKKNILKVS